MMKRAVALLLVVMLCFGSLGTSMANEHRDCKKDHVQHDHWLENILFGKQYSPSSRPKKLVYLENASYICIDQHKCNASTETDKQYNSLKEFGLTGYPETLELIQCPGGWAHRQYTHVGWNYTYKRTASTNNDWSEEKWQWRRKILMATTEKVFNFTPFVPDWLEFQIGYGKRCQHFSGLIYYVHLLGDHMELETPSDYANFYNRHEAYLFKLADRHAELHNDTFEEKAIIPALIYHMDALFDKESNDTYSALRTRLVKLNKTASSLSYQSTLSQTEFDEHKDYARKTYEELVRFLPSLLQEQPFFTKAFPNP